MSGHSARIGVGVSCSPLPLSSRTICDLLEMPEKSRLVTPADSSMSHSGNYLSVLAAMTGHKQQDGEGVSCQSPGTKLCKQAVLWSQLLVTQYTVYTEHWHTCVISSPVSVCGRAQPAAGESIIQHCKSILLSITVSPMNKLSAVVPNFPASRVFCIVRASHSAARNAMQYLTFNFNPSSRCFCSQRNRIGRTCHAKLSC